MDSDQTDDWVFEQISREFDDNKVDTELWAKAHAQSNGAKEKTMSSYIGLRAERLKSGEVLGVKLGEFSAVDSGSKVIETTGRVKVAGTLAVEIFVILVMAMVFISKGFVVAIVEIVPSFCFSLWLGYLLSGSQDDKKYIGLKSHAVILFVLFLLFLLPLIYTRDTRMFSNQHQQSIGMIIVFVVQTIFSAAGYFLTAKISRKFFAAAKK